LSPHALFDFVGRQLFQFSLDREPSLPFGKVEPAMDEVDLDMDEVDLDNILEAPPESGKLAEGTEEEKDIELPSATELLEAAEGLEELQVDIFRCITSLLHFWLDYLCWIPLCRLVWLYFFHCKGSSLFLVPRVSNTD
jgi:hypothetical protein